jgi:5-formyltetrahydrofolate cyclo-ligase
VLAEAKRVLRKQVLARRDALEMDVRARLSEIIVSRVIALPEFCSARSVLAYVSFGSELDTSRVIEAVIGTGKTLVLPRVERATKTLRLHRVNDPATCLIPGVLGIREPDPAKCPVIDPSDVAFVLVPGVAFSKACARLGYGAGFYDRLLPMLPAATPRIAAAFSLQVVDQVPVSSTDVPVDRVITENDEYCRS